MTKPKDASSSFSGSRVRLMPALIVTLGVVLSLRAAAVAETAADAASAGEDLSTAPSIVPPGMGEGAGTVEGAGPPPAEAAASACPAPSFADMAGLSQSEVAILQSLGQRRAQLDQRATEMETRSGLLSAAERRLEERVAELRRLETSVNELLGKLDEEQERRMTGLVDVYQRMRARDAAQVFDGLDDDTLLDVASRMRQQNLAEIMGQMQPVRARELTRMLAARAQPGNAQALLNAARGQPAAR